MSLVDESVVKNQYATAGRLQTRISIHEKYSRNKQPFGEWVVSHYHLNAGETVLELGCGTGSMWQGVVLPEKCRLTLTDLSAGMIETCKANTAHLQADYRVCDAMNLPWADGSFDVVIANMMLYHVPDIDRALSEIRRVMKLGGRFYAATFGEHGVVEAVCDLLGLPFSGNHRFTMENGSAQLSRHFSRIAADRREDALDITDVSDLIVYLRSMAGMTVLADMADEKLTEVFVSNMKDGVLSLPKDYGMFICTR